MASILTPNVPPSAHGNIGKPRHQEAAAWAEGLYEYFPWMTVKERQLFLIDAATLAVQHLEVATIATIVQDCGIATELVAGLTRALHGD